MVMWMAVLVREMEREWRVERMEAVRVWEVEGGLEAEGLRVWELDDGGMVVESCREGGGGDALEMCNSVCDGRCRNARIMRPVPGVITSAPTRHIQVRASIPQTPHSMNPL